MTFMIKRIESTGSLPQYWRTGKSHSMAIRKCRWPWRWKENIPKSSVQCGFLSAGRELFENPDQKLQFYEEKFYFADASVFEVFTFPLVSGNANTALTQPNTAVVTQNTAQKYFGTIDAIGKTFLSKGKIYTVTGIVKEAPSNSSIQFDALLSFATFPSDFGSWDSWYPDTYVLVADKRTPREVEHALASITEETCDTNV